jgi:hypothetical protein
MPVYLQASCTDMEKYHSEAMLLLSGLEFVKDFCIRRGISLIQAILQGSICVSSSPPKFISLERSGGNGTMFVMNQAADKSLTRRFLKNNEP